MKIKSIILIVILVASILSACSGKKPDDQEIVTLKINSSNLMNHAPIHIAEAEGYFAEYGIKMEYIPVSSSSKAIPLLVSGDIDIYAGPIIAGLLNTVSLEDDIKAVADRGHIAPEGCTYQALVIRKDLVESGKVAGPADLEGLTFSVQTANVATYLLSTYLSQGGLTLDNIKIVDLDTQSEIAAYANKAIDGGVGTEPHLTQILDSGEAVILAKAEEVLGAFQQSIIAFNKNLLVDNPGIGARFLAAYLKGVQQYNEGKTERNLEILADSTGETVENLKAVCWPGINNDGMIDFASVDGFQQWLIANDYLDNPVTEEQFWDPSFLVAAQKMLNH